MNKIIIITTAECLKIPGSGLDQDTALYPLSLPGVTVPRVQVQLYSTLFRLCMKCAIQTNVIITNLTWKLEATYTFRAVFFHI